MSEQHKRASKHPFYDGSSKPADSHGPVVRREELIGQTCGTVAPYNPNDPASVLKRAGRHYTRNGWIIGVVRSYWSAPEKMSAKMVTRLKEAMARMDKEDAGSS